MTQYEALDLIADTYTPVLAIASLILGYRLFHQGDRLAPLRCFLGVLACYILTFLDEFFRVWAKFSLDYSTHSAVAFAFIYFLAHKLNPTQKEFVFLMLSLVAYYLLEIYQEYHTLLDIASTCLIIAPVFVLIYSTLKRQDRIFSNV